MTSSRQQLGLLFMPRRVAFVLPLPLAGIARAQMPFPSWNEAQSRQEMITFVEAVTNEGSLGYATQAERIVVFDNDGTLCSERRYTSKIYACMLEVLDHLRGNCFKTYVALGGKVEFIYTWAESVYRIPPEQAIGRMFLSEFQMTRGRPVPARGPKQDNNDDGTDRPQSINKVIIRPPVFAFGNSDSDLQMLQRTTASSGKRCPNLAHHTDAKRECVDNEHSKVGKLDQTLDEVGRQDWVNLWIWQRSGEGHTHSKHSDSLI